MARSWFGRPCKEGDVSQKWGYRRDGGDNGGGGERRTEGRQEEEKCAFVRLDSRVGLHFVSVYPQMDAAGPSRLCVGVALTRTRAYRVNTTCAFGGMLTLKQTPYPFTDIGVKSGYPNMHTYISKKNELNE